MADLAETSPAETSWAVTSLAVTSQSRAADLVARAVRRSIEDAPAAADDPATPSTPQAAAAPQPGGIVRAVSSYLWGAAVPAEANEPE